MKDRCYNSDVIFPIVIALVCILIGSIMLYFGINKSIEYNNQIEKQYSITKGIVSDVKREKEDFGGEYIYVKYITINYTVEDKEYVTKEKYTKNVPNVNSILKLTYDKNTPEEVSVYRCTEEHVMYNILVLLGYIFAIFPLMILLAQCFRSTKYYRKISHLLIGLSFLGFSYVLLKFLTVNMFEFSFINVINVVGIMIFAPLIFMMIGIYVIVTAFTKNNKKEESVCY